MSTTVQQRIQAFLEAGPFAVVGASTDRDKYGNKVLRCYRQHGLEVFPINPREAEVEGLPAFASLSDLPKLPRAVSIITPPAVTERVLREAAGLGIRHLWLQPGAEGPAALDAAETLGLEVIAGGPCLLVVLGYHE